MGGRKPPASSSSDKPVGIDCRQQHGQGSGGKARNCLQSVKEEEECEEDEDDEMNNDQNHHKRLKLK